MAELNRVKLRLLGNYNSLLDEHLANYFSNPRIRKHLIKAGLVRQDGSLVSPEDYKARVLEEQRWLASQAFLAQAIVQKALDMEFSRRAQLQRQLEEIIRLELVERMRSARQRHQSPTQNRTPCPSSGFHRENLSGKKRQVTRNRKSGSARISREVEVDENESSSSSTDIENHTSDLALHNSQSKSRASGSASSKLRETAASPYSLSVIGGSRIGSRSRSASYNVKSRPNFHRKGMLYHHHRAHIHNVKNVNYSFCEVTLKFLGTRSFTKTWIKDEYQNVLIKQQFSGGNPNIVFSESISPGSTFTFTSRRYSDFPFNATVYVDSIVVLRLSACCEYKYHVGYRLGGPQGYFVLVGVKGMKSCAKCGAGKSDENFLPPVYHKPFNKTISFKPTNRKLAWSQSGNFSEKQVALIPPTEKQYSVENNQLLNSNQSGPWVLSVGVTQCEDESDKKEVKTENEAEMLSSTFKTLTVDETVVDEEEEIAEELVNESDEVENDVKGAPEVEESLPNQSISHSDTHCKKDDTDSGTVDSKSSSGTSDSDSESDSGSASESDSSTSTSDSKQTAFGPEITVSKPASAESESRSSFSTTSSGSSYSGSETGTSTENEKTGGQFLKPEDARRSVNIAQEKTRSISEKEKDIVKTPNLPLKSTDVSFDSSDDDDDKTEHQTTVVKADVHAEPKAVSNGSFESSSESVEKEQSSTDKKLVHQHSISVPDGGNAQTCLVKRNSLSQMLGRNPSEDTEKDDKDSQASSIQDNGSEIEINDEDISTHIAELCEGLHHRPELTTLTISKGGIDDLNIGPIIDALIGSNCPLKSLNLNYNHLGPQAGQQISRLVRVKPTLKCLYLRANPLHDSGLCPIVEALLQNNSAFQAPRDSKVNLDVGLQKLDIGDCTFRNEGATNLASLIEQSLSLESLILTGNNQLNDDDWSSIFWAVGQNPTVTTLFLDYCYLRDEGIDCLTNTIRDHPALEAVDLEWNQISDEGAKWIISWIKENPKLTQIRIETGNNIKEAILLDIKKALDRNLK